MAILVECPDCGQTSSVSVKAAGRKLKCPCGGVIQVPKREDASDDFERADDFGRRRRSSRRGGMDPMLKWGLVGGASLVGLLVLFVLYQFLFSIPAWQPDLALQDQLDVEQAGAGFVIRPPKGWRKVSEDRAPARHGAASLVTSAAWESTTGFAGEIGIRIQQNPGLRGRSWATIQTSEGVFADDGVEPLVIISGARVTYGTVAGKPTTRAEIVNPMSSVNLPASKYPTRVMLARYFDDKRVDIAFSCQAPIGSTEAKVLEESLKSLRPLGSGEILTVPLVPQSFHVNPIAVANTGTLPAALQQSPANNGLNRTNPVPNPVGAAGGAASKPTGPNQTGASPAKSGFAKSPAVTNKGGFKAADWGGGDEKQKNAKTEESPDWGAVAPIVAKTSGTDTVIDFPATESQFVLVGKGVYDIRTAEHIGDFPVGTAAGHGQFRALSPDGKLLASATNNTVDSGELVSLYELGGKGFGKILKTGDSAKSRDNQRVQFIKFSASNRLLVGTEKFGSRTANKIYIFNTETGKVAKEIQCAEVVPAAALTSDGRYLAMFTRNEIPVYDIQKAQKAASMELPSSDAQSPVFRNPGVCHGLSFSPNGTELAALMDGSRVIVWSSKGKIVYDEILPREVSSLWSNDAGGVVWLPDMSGWILGKQYLFDRQKKLLLWQLKRPTWRDESPIRMVDQTNVLAHVGDHRDGELATIPVPWDQIQQSLGGEDWESLALVKPGDEISINVEVFNVRFAQPQEVANAIGVALTKRIERSKFKVAQGKEVILKAVYNEEQGDSKRVVEGRGFSPFGGRDTGQRVNDTKGKLEIKIVTKDKGAVVWEQTITSDGGSTIKGDVSDANVRKQMFDYLSFRVNQLALPTMIPKPGGPLLPIVTDRER